jgi:hypothetical protein
MPLNHPSETGWISHQDEANSPITSEKKRTQRRKALLGKTKPTSRGPGMTRRSQGPKEDRHPGTRHKTSPICFVLIRIPSEKNEPNDDFLMARDVPDVLTYSERRSDSYQSFIVWFVDFSRGSFIGFWIVNLNLSEFDQPTLVVVAIHRAINQSQELVLGEQTLSGHLTQEVVGDIANLGRMTGLGPSPGLQTVACVVDEVVMITFSRKEPFRLKR